MRTPTLQNCSRLGTTIFCLSLLALLPPHVGSQELSHDQVLQDMKSAAMFFRNQVARHGGYVYFCSEDLSDRWGEGKADDDTIFVQPPATPTVGETYLTAYRVTGDRFYLDAAKETALSLVMGQLQSGGWAQVIHFKTPEKGRMGNYRKRKGGNWNNSSLDDDQTQAALQFLARVDQALEFKDDVIHEAVLYGLESLIKAQFNIGAFPQSWTGPAAQYPVLTASYPTYDWRTEGRIKEYWNCYTLNDNLAGTVAETLIVAHEIYGNESYLEALMKLGDFLIAAQMPQPQPAWCQQYNYQMQPMWARKFEPPAITGGESQDAIKTLLKIASYTGNKKYLEPIPAAISYLEKECLLANGRLARYYELKTNRPLYMNSKYELTYDDSDVPKHYSWTVATGLAKMKRDYQKVADGKKLSTSSAVGLKEVNLEDVRKVIDSLDSQGRWVSQYAGEKLVGQPKFPKGFRYISSEVFNNNMTTLSSFLSEK